MSTAVQQCGTVCEWHWFDTDPEHIHQPPISIVDDETLKRRRIQWVKEGVREGEELIGANPRAALYMFMQDCTRTEMRQIAKVVATNGDPDALEHPCGHLVKSLRKLDDDAAAEAWELFGQGVKP